MINDNEIYEALFSKLNESFSNEMVFYKAFQGNTRNYDCYATIYVQNYKTKDTYKKYFDKENPKEQQSNTLSFLIQIDFFNNVDDLLSVVERVKAFLRSDNCAYVFNKKGLYIKNFSQIRSLPEKEKNKWRYRKSFDFNIEFMDSHEFAVDYILHADIKRK